MHDAVFVRALERAGDRDHELHERAHRHPLLEELRQRLALEVLEHHERKALVLADLEDGDDVLVRATRRRPRLDHEATDEVRIVVEQELDRDLATELRVACEEDLAHAAARELADQPEPSDLLRVRELQRLTRIAFLAAALRARLGRASERLARRQHRRRGPLCGLLGARRSRHRHRGL